MLHSVPHEFTVPQHKSTRIFILSLTKKFKVLSVQNIMCSTILFFLHIASVHPSPLTLHCGHLNTAVGRVLQ
jgi:hypothetical protein